MFYEEQGNNTKRNKPKQNITSKQTNNTNNQTVIYAFLFFFLVPPLKAYGDGPQWEAALRFLIEIRAERLEANVITKKKGCYLFVL